MPLFGLELLMIAALFGIMASDRFSPVSAFISNEFSGSGAHRPDAENSRGEDHA